MQVLNAKIISANNIRCLEDFRSTLEKNIQQLKVSMISSQIGTTNYQIPTNQLDELIFYCLRLDTRLDEKMIPPSYSQNENFIVIIFLNGNDFYVDWDPENYPSGLFLNTEKQMKFYCQLMYDGDNIVKTPKNNDSINILCSKITTAFKLS